MHIIVCLGIVCPVSRFFELKFYLQKIFNWILVTLDLLTNIIKINICSIRDLLNQKNSEISVSYCKEVFSKEILIHAKNKHRKSIFIIKRNFYLRKLKIEC